MCDFFSFTSDGKGSFKYFNAELREKCRTGELKYNPDSHTSINDYYGFVGAKEDNRNKYEYNPILQKFVIDQLNTTDDSKEAFEWVKSLDFKTIVPELIIKPIVNPFTILPPKIDSKAIDLLKQWASVRDSVGDSVGDSVRDSVGDSVRASVWASVWDSVRASVWDSVWDSVGDSVGDSVWASVRGYISSFFVLKKWKYIDHEPYKNPYQSGIDLWEMGLVPVYYNNTWHLHGGKDGKSLFSISKTELMERA